MNNSVLSTKPLTNTKSISLHNPASNKNHRESSELAEKIQTAGYNGVSTVTDIMDAAPGSLVT